MRLVIRRSRRETFVAWSLAIAVFLMSFGLPAAMATNQPHAIGSSLQQTAIHGAASGDKLRKIPGPSPQQTIDNFLALTGEADREIRAAIQSGMREPGWRFSNGIHARVEHAEDKLQQSTQALDLTQIAPALRPMTGVGRMLQLRSLLLYDLEHSPQLKIPDEATTKEENIEYWSMPNTPLSLAKVNRSNIKDGKACKQCSAGDFLFSSESINQVPEQFQLLFEDNSGMGKKYGADIYSFWALLPGGALPPKIFFELPKPLRKLLLTPTLGQSLLQWILLLPVTVAGIALSYSWLMFFRRWRGIRAGSDDIRVYLVCALFILPPFLLLLLWQWYAIQWVNLIGYNQEAVLIICRILSGLLLAIFAYFSAEALGQLAARTRRHSTDGSLLLVRRKGAGQIMTIARILGILGVFVILINVGRDLGLTSLTLLGLASIPALAISLGTKQLINDIADGFSILLDGQIKVGDRCTIGTSKSGQIIGKVLSLGMRSMRLELEDGSEVSIPNSSVGASVITNHRFRSSQPWKMNLAINVEDPSTMLLLLQQVRQVVENVQELIDGQVELEPCDTGWQFKISGSWNADHPKGILLSARQELHLRLMELLHGHVQTAPIVDGQEISHPQ